MPAHFDLLIRNGNCVLPWGIEATDVGVRDGRIAALGVGSGATADATIDADGLHVLPGLIDPHVHLRDPGDKAVESIPTGTRAAVLGGLAAVFDMPNTSPSITDADTARLEAGLRRAQITGATSGYTLAAPRQNIPELHIAGTGPRSVRHQDLCRQFHRRPDGGRRRASGTRDARPAADASRITARTNTGCRIASRLFKSGDPYSSHMEWRDEECAFLGTRRLMALAREDRAAGAYPARLYRARSSITSRIFVTSRPARCW